MIKNGMRPVHPGEVLLEDYIKPAGISVSALALALGVPYLHVLEIVAGTRGVSDDMALRLEQHFGGEAQGWLNLQAAYDLRRTEIARQEQLAAKNGKHVTKITLASGAVGWLASDVPMAAIRGLLEKLLRQRSRLQKRRDK
jgi:addiction module HigA family antidote